MMSRNTRMFVLSGAVACALVSFADYPEDAILTVPYTQFPSPSAKFRDRDGNTTNWVDGSYMVFLHETNGKWPGTTNLQGWFDVRGLRFETHYDGEYFETGGGFRIGAAGLEMTVAGSNVAMGRNDVHGLAGRIILMENQVWKGPASGDNAVFSFTCENYTHTVSGNSTYNMHNDFLKADPSVTSWTVQDHLTVWFCHTNALENVDVRIVNPARIRCRTKVFDSDSSTYYAGLHAKSLTLSGDAEMWQAGGKVTSYFKGHASTMQPLLDSITIAPTLILEDGADMKLIGAQWDIPTLRVTGAGATSSLKGDCTFLRANTAVELQDGATLELPATNRESGVSAGITVTGTGTLKIVPSEWHLTGTLALGNDVVLLMGAGAFDGAITGGGRCVINPGADKECVFLTGTSGSSITNIEVQSGTCRLLSMAAMPANAKFVVADGAKLLFSTDDGYDASRVTLNGSGECSVDGLCVTDIVVAREEIVVNAGEVLSIYGNGLTAATRVTLAGGTMRFERNGVTVASPVLVTDNSIIESLSTAVTGTVSGVIACTNVATSPSSVVIPKLYTSGTTTASVRGLWVLGPGTVIFSGGGMFSNRDGDRLVLTRGARAHLTGGTYRFEVLQTNSDYAPIHMRELVAGDRSINGAGRHLCVRDGGDVQFASSGGGYVEPKIFVVGPKDGSYYDSTTMIPVFEIGQGGTVTLPVNSIIYLGYTDNRVHLKITGGTLNLETASSRLYFGGPGALTSCGEIYLESGTLSTGCSLWRNSGNQSNNRFCRGRLIWSGGTLKLNANFREPNIFDMPAACYSATSPQQSGMLRVSTRLIGENCVLDLSDLQADSVTNVPAVLDEAEWYGHGCLTVKGGKELVMNSVPDGFSLKLEGEGTRVKVAEGAYVYDYDTCYQYKDWAGYDKGNSYSVTNTALSALSVAGYTLAGTNCGFSVARTMPVSVTNTTVTAGGGWNGAVALTAAGALDAQNLTFEEGSLLSVPYANGETAAFSLTGELMLPAAMAVRAVPAAGAAVSGTTVFTAAEGITGSPAWNMLTGRFKIFADGSHVWIVPKGTMLTIR